MNLEEIYATLGILAAIVFLYTLVAKKVEDTIISGPMIYVALGLVLGAPGLGLIGTDASSADLRLLADITLALILFSDAAHANLSVVRKQALYPTRMLALGLPGAIAIGFAVGYLLFDEFSVIEAAILATMLAATDAALGKAVITNPSVPTAVREGLNVESGLNDGLCVPILLILITMASSGQEHVTTSHALVLVGEEIGIGLAVGLSFAFIGAKLLIWSANKQWLSEVWGQLTVAAIALASFGLAQALHGSGYIAAFSGGMLFGHLLSSHTHKLVLTTESIAELFAMLTWVLFGAAVVALLLDYLSLSIFIYAALSLTLVRILPIYLSFLGTSVSSGQRLFMGWFGPRGLASLVFAIIVLDAGVANAELIAVVVSTTVIFSLIAHGISAKPLASKLGAKQQ
ncbi:cation:proton antiporter [Agarivorans sp. JK6]|uniref:cation:proton antiporter n=1 Tax=Agarivorans sp. JK6 TaxID=2997426 RepID=UPI0038739373